MKKLARGVFALGVTAVLVAGAGLGRCVHNNCPIRICKCS